MLSLGGSLGLLFLVHAVRNSGWALPVVFAFTGFLGYTLGPVLARTLALPGGGQLVAFALGATGLATLALSAFALRSRRDFSAWGGMLLVGLVIAIVAGLAAVFLQIPALALAVAAMVALISAGMILVETSRIVNGGETNYVLATVGLYLSIYNLFSSLLALMGMGGEE
jgi:modulator of FtsH protease